MILNPMKCTFEASAGKFLEHLVTQRGIEENPNVVRALIDMPSM